MGKITIKGIDRAPDLNGDLTQPAWKNAQWNSGFTVAGQPEVKAARQTAFAMVYDADNLYVAVRCEIDPVQPQETGWESEDPKGEIQLVVDSEGTGLRAGLFMVFGNGTSEVKIVDTEGLVNDWPGTIRCASKTEGTAWVVQFVVKLAEFKYGVSSHQQWRFNLVRLPSKFSQPRWSTFAPLNGAIEAEYFFEPQHAGAIAVFERSEAVEPFLWTVGPAGRARVVETAKGRICRQELRVTNLLSRSRSVELQYRIYPGADVTLSLQFEPGQARLETIAVPVEPDFEFGQFHVALVEPGTSRCVSESYFFVESEPLSWKEHFVKRSDGKGSYTPCPAQMQFLPRFEGRKVLAYGLVQMDNSEIIMTGTAVGLQTVVAFSKDGGATWSEYQGLNRGSGEARTNICPMYLTYLGKGSLSILQGLNLRIFSHDYGRTWTEEAPYPPAPDGWPMMVEGNNMVDRDAKGNAVRIAETGQTYPAGGVWPGGVPGQPETTHCSLWFHWSNDGGRTWGQVSRPEAWRWQETYRGKTFNFSAYEGGLVRAANGWIVAALRMNGLAKYISHPFLDDQFMGTGVSISKDDGKSWSPIQRILEEGRHHSNLVRLSNGDLVMTVIRRIDIRGGKLASYRRGCDAVVSRDNGLTWDVEHMYALDDFPVCEGDRWNISRCGHLYSTVLDDGFILTTFGNHMAGGELVKWKP